MKINRFKLVLILTSITLLGACVQEEQKKEVTMVDKKEESQNSEDNLPKELIAEPVTQAEALENNAKGEVTMKGSIVFKDLELNTRNEW